MSNDKHDFIKFVKKKIKRYVILYIYFDFSLGITVLCFQIHSWHAIISRKYKSNSISITSKILVSIYLVKL